MASTSAARVTSAISSNCAGPAMRGGENWTTGSAPRAAARDQGVLDSWSALILAEQLELPLFTASDEVASDRVEILHPW